VIRRGAPTQVSDPGALVRTTAVRDELLPKLLPRFPLILRGPGGQGARGPGTRWSPRQLRGRCPRSEDGWGTSSAPFLPQPSRSGHQAEVAAGHRATRHGSRHSRLAASTSALGASGGVKRRRNPGIIQLIGPSDSARRVAVAPTRSRQPASTQEAGRSRQRVARWRTPFLLSPRELPSGFLPSTTWAAGVQPPGLRTWRRSRGVQGPGRGSRTIGDRDPLSSGRPRSHRRPTVGRR
jgi:hypothetical protein